jgi:hypothetical protein
VVDGVVVVEELGYELAFTFPLTLDAVYTSPSDVTATAALLPLTPVIVVTSVVNPSV